MANFSFRWAQLDLARQMETIDFIEKFITLLADSNYNGLLLYLEDRIKTPSYQLPDDRECYTVEQIKHIIDYAAGRNIEVIPCVATLGHAERFLKHPEMADMAEVRGDMTGRFFGKAKLTFCITHPQFYDFIGTYLREIAEIFPSKFFHVGLDEFWDFNLCERCQAAMPTLADEQKMFLKHVIRIREIMQQCGKRMIMWSDMFEFYPDVFKEIPRDVIMMDWQYQNDVRNYRGHLLDVDVENRLAVNAELGFDCMAAPADRVICNAESYFEYADGKPHVIGAILTSWEKTDNYLYRCFPITMAAGLMMSGMDCKEAFAAMCRKLFGDVDEAFCALLRMILTCGLPRHFELLDINTLCSRSFYGLFPEYIAVCRSSIVMLEAVRHQISTELGLICIDDILAALQEKIISYDAWKLVHEIFDNRCSGERMERYRQIRDKFADYLHDMSLGWQKYRPGIEPDYFAENQDRLLARLDDLGEALQSDTYACVTCTQPDGYGVEFLAVEFRCGGVWHHAGRGVFKPGMDEPAVFCQFLPVKERLSGVVDAVRLTADGLGGIGVNFVEIVIDGRRYVPAAVSSVAGDVRDPGFILNNNMTFAWLGNQSTRLAYFDRHVSGAKHTVQLVMKEFSTSDIIMAEREKK